MNIATKTLVKTIMKILQWIDKRSSIILFVIVLTAAFVYYPSLFNGFTDWDDVYHITFNKDIQELSLNNLHSIFTSYYIGMYHPLTTLTFALNYYFCQLEPFCYHLTNYLFHLANILLVFYLVKHFSTESFVALFTALTFAIHPMHVESVAWITERKDVLYTFFYFVSLLLYFKYKTTEQKRYYWLSLGAFILSLLSKSAAVTLPLVLLAIEWYKQKHINKNSIVDSLPFFAFSLVFGIISLFSQHAGNHPYFHRDFNFIDRTFFTTYSLWFYITSYFLPLHLSAIHPYPTKVNDLLPALYYFTPLFAGVIIIFFFRQWSLQREYRFALLFFLSTIILVLQIFPLGYAIVAERYTYVPYIGISFFIGNVIVSMLKKYPSVQMIICILLIVFVTALGIKTYNQTEVWKNTITLFTASGNSLPTDYARKNMLAFAYNLVGNTRLALKDYSRAVVAYNNSIALNNEISETYYSRGIAYFHSGEYKKAAQDFANAIAYDPLVPTFYKELGTTELRLKNYEAALNAFAKAIELAPTEAIYYHERGITLLRMKKYTDALADFNKAIQLKPEWGKAFANRGIVYFNLGETHKACNDFHTAYLYNFTEAEELIRLYCAE